MHIPVLLAEVLAALEPQDQKAYVDATFGEGGYTSAILNHANCQVIAIDQDIDAITKGQMLVTKFAPRLQLLHGNFAKLDKLINLSAIDGIVFDLGVSSNQLDTPARGFSFRSNGPLDMRMNTQTQLTAAEVVNQFSEQDLCQIIADYGEEKHAKKIAQAIVNFRKKQPILDTLTFANIIRENTKGKPGKDPATKTFQGIRIFINDELRNIYQGLENAGKLLINGGKIIIVTFHGLEDRVVKMYMRSHAQHFKKIERPILPTRAEIKNNPRSRSAKLHVYQKNLNVVKIL